MKIKLIVVSFLFFIISFLLYSNTLYAPFVFDDIPNIVENQHIKALNPGYFFRFENLDSRPISYLSFMLDYKINGFYPVGFHLINILIHALVGILLYHLLSLLYQTGKAFKALDSNRYIFFFFISILWLVNPVHVQSVTYIVQRMNSLAAFFVLLSLICYVKGRLLQKTGNKTHKTLLYFAGSIVSFFLALGSKQMAITLPVNILLIEFIFIQESPWNFFKKNIFFFLIASVALVTICFFMTNNDPVRLILSSYAKRDFTLEQRLFTQLRVVLFYITLFAYPNPSRLNLEHDFSLSNGLFDPITTFASLVIILSLLGIAVLKHKKEPVLSFAIFFYFCNLIVESSFIGLEIIFEHRIYLPSMFLVTCAIYYLFKYFNSKLCYTICVILICLSSYWTFQRNQVWSSEQSLLEDCTQKSPNKYRPHYNLGIVYAEKGNSQGAIKSFKRAIRLNPDYASIHTNLAIELMKIKDYENAELYLLKSLEIKQDYSYTLNAIAKLYFKTGKNELALKYFKKNIKLNPSSYEANKGYGDFLFSTGEMEKAFLYYKVALGIKENVDILNNLSMALAAVGDEKKAIPYLLRAMKIDPENKLLKKNLMAVLSNRKKNIELQIEKYPKKQTLLKEYDEITREKKQVDKLLNMLYSL